MFNNGTELNIYNDYLNLLNDNSVENIEKFNNKMSIVEDFSNWTPTFTNCLIEPLKICFNFGDISLMNIQDINYTFDIDIKVNIDDPAERNNAVGWRCGSKNTKYLSWVTGDNIYGGPEIVLVDVETYKMYNTKKEMSILVNACFNESSQLESNKITVNISWKGYFYVRTFEHLPYNIACCENLLFKVIIDLETNFIKDIELVYYVPVISSFGVPGNTDFNLSIGYIKVLQSDLSKLPESIKINNKQFMFYSNESSLEFDMQQIEQFIYNNYKVTYNSKTYILKDIIAENFLLNWEEIINLNYNDLKTKYTVFYIEQCFIKELE